MNRISLAIIVALFGLLPSVQAQRVTLTPEDQSEVRKTLEDYQAGKISLDEITIDRDEAWGRKLLTYFVMDTNAVTTKMKLPISRCFAGFGKYPEALVLAQDYVSVYSNDWHAWRIIGSANLFMTNYSAALSGYTNAVRLGDDISYVALGGAALKTDRLDIISNMVPRYLALKAANLTTNRHQAIQLAGVLVIYSLRTEQKDIFVSAIAGFEPEEILVHDDLTFLVKQGCDEFSGKEIDKIRQELEPASKP